MALTIVTAPYPYYPDPTQGKPVFNGSIFIGEPDLDPEIEGNQKTISIKQEDGTVVSVLQPVKTSAGGIAVFDGSSVDILVDGNYSLKVLNKKGKQVYFLPDRFEGQPITSVNLSEFTNIGFDSVADMVTNGTGLKLGDFISLEEHTAGNESGVIFGKVVEASTGTADNLTFIDLPNTTPALQFQQNLPEVISIRKGGADKTGATDSTAAMKAARDTGRTVYFPGVDVAGGEFYEMTDSVNPVAGQKFFGDGFNSLCKFTPEEAAVDGHLMGFVGASSIDLHEKGSIVGLHLDCGSVFNMNGIGVTKAKGTLTQNCYFTEIGRKAWTAQNDVFCNKFLDSHIISASQEENSTRPAISIEGQTASNDSFGNIVDNITVQDAGFHLIGITDSKNNIVSNIHVSGSVTSRMLFLVGTADGDCEGNQLSNIISENGSLIGIECSRANNNGFSDIDLAPSSQQGVVLNITSPDNTFNRVKAENTAGVGVQHNSPLITGTKYIDCDITGTTDGYSIDGPDNVIRGGSITADRGVNLLASNNTVEGVDIDGATSGVNINGAFTGSMITRNRFGSSGTSILIFTTAVDSFITNNESASSTPVSGPTDRQKDYSGNSWNFRKGRGTSIPTSGSWTAGDLVENDSSSAWAPDASDMILFGWKRRTTGSDHALGTDWEEMFISTVSPAA